MQISGIGATPYIYNTSQVTSASLNKISGIGEDVAAQKTDFSGLATDSSAQNMNPLKPGESKNFMDILSSQMAMSQMNASRVMQMPQLETEQESGALAQNQNPASQAAAAEQLATEMTA